MVLNTSVKSTVMFYDEEPGEKLSQAISANTFLSLKNLSASHAGIKKKKAI